MKFSDYIVFVDESGDHSLTSIDPEFPMFALSFCVFKKAEYLEIVIPAIQRIKFDFWGHDTIIFHEHEIRKTTGEFAILRTSRELREAFLARLNSAMEQAPVQIIASVIDKHKHTAKYPYPWSPYRIALHFCLERLFAKLRELGEIGKLVHVVFECRGKAEDADLELAFRRIVSGSSQWGWVRQDFSSMSFEPIFAKKSENSVGLQLADLTARPLALSVLRPGQPNRALAIIVDKLWGLKTFP